MSDLKEERFLRLSILGQPVLWLVLSLLVYSIYVLDLIYQSSGVLDPGDGISHYHIARWSWEYPRLFLHHWGKPVYTLLSSPFAQFGIKGMMVFNWFITVLTCIYIHKICNKLKLKGSLLAIVITVLSPVYFEVLMAGLTEALCASMLVIGIYYLLSQKYWLATILLSFTPYVRTEMYFILPWFGLYLLCQKQWKMCLGLTVGTFVYTIIGGLYYNDFLWIINEMTYLGVDKDVYGSGELTHFYDRRYMIFGQWGSNLLLIGFVSLLLRMAFRKRLKHSDVSREINMLILMWGPLVSLFVMHSYFWYDGGYASLGLIRVIIPVLPLAGIAGIHGLSWLELIDTKKWIKPSVIFVVTVAIGLTAFSKHMGRHTYPLEQTPYEAVITKAADFYKTNYEGRRVHYFHPLFLFRADICPFDEAKSFKPYGIEAEAYSNKMALGELLVWDSQFGIEHGSVQLSELMNCQNLSFVGVFTAKEPIKVYNGQDWGVYIFERKDKVTVTDTVVHLSMARSDFQTRYNSERFSDLLEHNFVDPNPASIYQAKVKLTIRALTDVPSGTYTSTTAVIQNGETMMYRAEAIPNMTMGDNYTAQFEYILPNGLETNGNVRTYFENANSGQAQFEIVHLELVIISMKDL